MAFKEPQSMSECVYFTNRSVETNGRVRAWAYKALCPKCKKGRMGKPVEKGKVKTRATEYVCPNCGYTEGKPEHESRLTLQIIYRCPFCGHEAAAEAPYMRKKWNGVPSYVFECGGCKKSIGITKKMK